MNLDKKVVDDFGKEWNFSVNKLLIIKSLKAYLKIILKSSLSL